MNIGAWNDTEDVFEATVTNYAETYAFGMLMPNRSLNADNQRFLFQNMEQDMEVSGSGNSYTTEFRQYSLSRCMFSRFYSENRSKTTSGNPRLGRWKSLDALMFMFPHLSPYVGFDNNPIYFVDSYGLSSEKGDGGGENQNNDAPDDPPAKGLPVNPEDGKPYVADDGKTYSWIEGAGWATSTQEVDHSEKRTWWHVVKGAGRKLFQSNVMDLPPSDRLGSDKVYQYSGGPRQEKECEGCGYMDRAYIYKDRESVMSHFPETPQTATGPMDWGSGTPEWGGKRFDWASKDDPDTQNNNSTNSRNPQPDSPFKTSPDNSELERKKIKRVDYDYIIRHIKTQDTIYMGVLHPDETIIEIKMTVEEAAFDIYKREKNVEK